jgi:hypothetical protein
MDPITLAAKRLHCDIDAFWNPHPGALIALGPRVLRLVVSASERGDLLKALRWLEWSSASRRPIILFEEPFEDEPRWLRALIAKTADDCEAVRKGFAEDGVRLTLPPARPADAVLDATTARRYLDATAECMVNGSLDGLFVAVVPKRVTDPRAYRATLARLTASPVGAALRLAVLDIPGTDQELRALVPTEARFEVDRAELFGFLKQIGLKPSAGPAIRKPSWSSALPSWQVGETLRVLLLDAGEALATGKAWLAVQHFEAAQELSHHNDLTAQECAIGIGLGSAHVVAGDEPAALAAYDDAVRRALEAELRPLAAQALLGMAGIHFSKGRYAEARIAYEIIARLSIDVPSLAEEAQHMQKRCRELERVNAEEEPRSRKEIAIAH